jgi:hypothetical protein
MQGIENAHQPVVTTLGMLRVFCSALSPLPGLPDLGVEFLLEPPPPEGSLEEELWEGEEFFDDFFDDDEDEVPAPAPLELSVLVSAPLP